MLLEDRITYSMLKRWALESYFVGCRDLALTMGRSHAEVLGFVSSAYPEGFDRPLENCMWRVILLVLSGGMSPEIEQGMRERISDQLSAEGLDDLLQGVPHEEAEAFKNDLKILKLIS
jgi:hypothetical protein